MMKKLTKKYNSEIHAVFFALILVASAFFDVFASNNVKIPGKMTPKSIIEFDKDFNIIVIDKGTPELEKSQTEHKYEPVDLDKMSEAQKQWYYEEKKILEENDEIMKYYPVMKEEILPEPGMRVVYDEEGFVQKIEYPETTDDNELENEIIKSLMNEYEYEIKNNQEQSYLSISYITYDKEKKSNKDRKLNRIYYDIKNDKLEKTSPIQYESSRVLSAYSKSDNMVYFSPLNEKGIGRNLFALDINTGKKRQLINDGVLIDRIIPRKYDVLLLVTKKGTSNLRLAKYDKKTGETVYDDSVGDDMSIWAIGLNSKDENEFYTATFSQAQKNENTQKKFDKLDGKYYYADFTLNRYTGDFSTKEKFRFFPKEEILSISANDKSILIVKDSDFIKPDAKKIIKIDKTTGKQTEIKKDGMYMSNIRLSPDSDGMYFIGSYKGKKDTRGVYYLDFNTMAKKSVFLEQEGVGVINDFTFISE